MEATFDVRATTMRFHRLLLPLLLVTSCVDHHRVKHAERTHLINDRYQHYRAATLAAAEVAIHDLRVIELKYGIEIDRSTQRPVDSLEDKYRVPLKNCQGDKTCENRVISALTKVELQTYYLANFPWVQAHAEESDSLEKLLAYSHNRKVYSQTAPLLDEIRTTRDRQLVELDRHRIRSLNDSREQMEAAQQEEARIVLAGIAGGLRAAGESLSRPSLITYEPQLRQPLAFLRGCSSDYDCGAGRQCLKDNNSSSGRCIQTVNRYGGQTYESPRMDSVQVKVPSKSDCRSENDCGPGFICDRASGACLK
jgi:hypothetical protein